MKSQTRVKATGEVFTPSPLVEEMLSKLPDDAWNQGKMFLDNSCGNGQFLAKVYQIKKELGDPNPLASIYGVDLMADNVCDTIARLAYLEYGIEDMWDESGVPSPDINHPGHSDDHTYDWLIANLPYERKYLGITVRFKGLNPGHAAIFEYQFDGEDDWLAAWNIVCYDALKYDYGFEQEIK
jgi:type I restriction-modification system DNA methylase subunit